MTLQQIYEKVAEELGLPVSLVAKTYRADWQFIRASISELPLKEDLTEQDFNSLHTCFNIPSLGKLHCTYPRYVKIKKRFKLIKELKDNDNKED